MTLARIGVAIPTFSAGKYLTRALESVKISADRAGLSITIVVVDCHPLSLDKHFISEDVTYVTLPHNPGFGTASNEGLRQLFSFTDINYVLLLNPDAYIKEDFFSILLQGFASDFPTDRPIAPLILFSNTTRVLLDSSKVTRSEFSTALQYLLDEDVSLYTRKGKELKKYGGNLLDLKDIFLVTSNDTKCFHSLPPEKWDDAYFINNASSFYTWPDIAGDISFELLNTQQNSTRSSVGAAWCGAGVVLPRSYLVSTQGFDERFFLYYEDTELSVRGANLGLPPEFIPSLVIYHEHSLSTGKNQKVRSRAIWTSRSLFATICAGKGTALIGILGRFIIPLLKSSIRSWPHLLRSYLLSELFFSVKGLMRGSFQKPRNGRFQ
jgi:GT2 family glycosyltransferase